MTDDDVALLTDEGRAWEVLRRDPSDWATRLILADLMEEQGRDAEAEAMRWMGRKQLCPYPTENGTAYWYSIETVVRIPVDLETLQSHILGYWLFTCLPSFDLAERRSGVKGYRNWMSAERAFRHAFIEAKREGWDGWKS